MMHADASATFITVLELASPLLRTVLDWLGAGNGAIVGPSERSLVIWLKLDIVDGAILRPSERSLVIRLKLGIAAGAMVGTSGRKTSSSIGGIAT